MSYYGQTANVTKPPVLYCNMYIILCIMCRIIHIASYHIIPYSTFRHSHRRVWGQCKGDAETGTLCHFGAG